MSWNLRNKLLIPTLAMVFIGFVSISAFSYMAARDNIRETIVSDAGALTRGLGDTIQMILSASTMDVQTMAGRRTVHTLLGEGDSDALDAVENQMKATIAIQPFYTSMTLLNAKGVIVAGSSSKSRGGDRKDRDYFVNAKNSNFTISAPSTSKSSGASIIIFSAPVRDESKNFIGAATAVMDLKKFSTRYIAPVSLGGHGAAMIMDGKGRLVAHKELEKIAQEVPEAIKKGVSELREDNGYFPVEIDGVPMYCFVQKEKQSGWTGLILASEAELFEEVRAMALISLVLALVGLVLTGLVTFFVIRGVTSDLDKGVAFASAVASGNLDQRLEVKRNDELGRLADALRVMVDNLKEMLATSEQKSAEAREQSGKAAEAMLQADEARKEAELARRAGMHQAAEQLGSIASALTNATDLLLQQVSRAASGSDSQRQQADEASSAVYKMESTVRDVAHSATSAADSAIQTKEKAESGSQVVGGVLKAVSEVDEKTSQLKTHMHELGETARSISQVMSVINDIADQTNLLALNAAIEAARAGEAGRGFAVVADEVRKLAEKTMGATGEVGSAVTAIQNRAESNIKGMDEASEAVSRSTALVHEADAALREIVHIAEITADKVHSIASASEEQSAASADINRNTDSINAIAHENSNLMADASHAVDGLMELTRKISTLVEDLKKA